MNKNISFHLNKEYLRFLNQLKEKLHLAQMRATLAANTEQIRFYWETGKAILEQQKHKTWGSKFLEQLSHDMQKDFPEMQGFSVGNLKRMRLFADTFPTLQIGSQPVSQLPWGHISVLLHKLNNNLVREWYAHKIIKHGWSRSILEMQIESGLYERQASNNKKIANFSKFLPQKESDLARDMLKDPYRFDFLTIHGKAYERSIETGLIAHIRDFLIELGQGFAFVGSQVPLAFDDQEFFIDLLFYHLNLRCYIVAELKATKFKPEHTGQLGFYLAAVDDQLKKECDNRTIGILLCKTKDKVIAEYALRNINAPIGVSEYTLAKALPKEFKSDLPTIEEIETELNEPPQKPKSSKK